MDHRRHDISNRVWNLLEPHLSGRAGSWGGIAADNRRFINAVFWILRTGAPWRDLPPRLWELEEYPSPFLPLARQGNVGRSVGNTGVRAGL